MYTFSLFCVKNHYASRCPMADVLPSFLVFLLYYKTGAHFEKIYSDTHSLVSMSVCHPFCCQFHAHVSGTLISHWLREANWGRSVAIIGILWCVDMRTWKLLVSVHLGKITKWLCVTLLFELAGQVAEARKNGQDAWIFFLRLPFHPPNRHLPKLT